MRARCNCAVVLDTFPGVWSAGRSTPARPQHWSPTLSGWPSPTVTPVRRDQSIPITECNSPHGRSLIAQALRTGAVDGLDRWTATTRWPRPSTGLYKNRAESNRVSPGRTHRRKSNTGTAEWVRLVQPPPPLRVLRGISPPSNWRRPYTLKSGDQPPAEFSHQKVSGLPGAVPPLVRSGAFHCVDEPALQSVRSSTLPKPTQHQSGLAQRDCAANRRIVAIADLCASAISRSRQHLLAWICATPITPLLGEADQSPSTPPIADGPESPSHAVDPG